MKYMLFFLLSIFSLFYPLEATIIPTADVKPIHEAFVMKYEESRPPTLIMQPPPANIDEQKVPQPSPDLVWIPGYWTWSENAHDFIWVCGVWRKAPVDHTWIAGSWVSQGNGWLWARGFWSPTKAENLQIIAKAPPAPLNDKVPPSPDKKSFWIPGHWQYSSSGEYSWLSGTWTPMQEGLILIPATYIWRPTGYIFVPLYWDWTLEDRGYAYECEGRGPMIQMEPQAIVQNLYIFYPDYITLFHYYWVYYPIWWEGCGCIPPWWGWNDWWSLCGCDVWGLWWWWGHPGFPPPFWLTPELALQIAPPPIIMVDIFKNVPKPDFPFNPGNDPLQPGGTPGAPEAPLPEIPNDVPPGGKVTPPTPPGGSKVTPPSPPRHPSPPPHLQPVPPPSHGQPPRSPVTPPRSEPPVRPPVTPPRQPTHPPVTPPRPEPPVRPPVTPPQTQQPPKLPPSQTPPVTPPRQPTHPPVTPPRTQQPPSKVPNVTISPNRPNYPTGPSRQIPSSFEHRTTPSANYPNLNQSIRGVSRAEMQNPKNR